MYTFFLSFLVKREATTSPSGVFKSDFRNADRGSIRDVYRS